MIEIKLNTLKKVTDTIFKKMKSKGEYSIHFTEDYNREVPEESLTDMSCDPTLIVGSLEDDIKFLEEVVKEGVDVHYLELERLAAIFRVLSIKLTL